VTVRIGHLSQEVTELPATLRVLEAVEDVARVVELGKGRTLSATQLCERFGFVGERQWTLVAELSGGDFVGRAGDRGAGDDQINGP